MEEDEYNFREPNDRIEGLMQSTQTNDIAEFVDNLREDTQFELDERMVWALIAVFFIRAIAELIRRSTDGARPIIEVAAEKWRDQGENDPYREV